MPSDFASPTRASVHMRTWETPPGICDPVLSRTAWIESTASRNGRSARAVCNTCSRSRPGTNPTASAGMPRRRARAATCPWDSSPLARRHCRPCEARWATRCSSSVDLPMPGSPASSMTEAGTSPPPSTAIDTGEARRHAQLVDTAPADQRDRREGRLRPAASTSGSGLLDRAPAAAPGASPHPSGDLLPALAAGQDHARLRHRARTLAADIVTPMPSNRLAAAGRLGGHGRADDVDALRAAHHRRGRCGGGDRRAALGSRSPRRPRPGTGCRLGDRRALGAVARVPRGAHGHPGQPLPLGGGALHPLHALLVPAHRDVPARTDPRHRGMGGRPPRSGATPSRSQRSGPPSRSTTTNSSGSRPRRRCRAASRRRAPWCGSGGSISSRSRSWPSAASPRSSPCCAIAGSTAATGHRRRRC